MLNPEYSSMMVPSFRFKARMAFGLLGLGVRGSGGFGLRGSVWEGGRVLWDFGKNAVLELVWDAGSLSAKLDANGRTF